MRSKYIVIEGLEGAGKTTARNVVVETLEQLGIRDMVFTREPGGTQLAEKLRSLVLDIKSVGDEVITDKAEVLMFYAARVQLVETVIKPALANGTWVIGDRHDLSTQAYQGGGRGIDQHMLATLRDAVLGDFRPDLTLYLDVTPEVGLKRARARGELDRIEQESFDFFNRTRARYLELVASLRDARPDIALSTDLIVGFPGETEEDFAATLELMRASDFMSSFSFCYSDRPGTRASRFLDKIAPDVQQDRLLRLQALQEELSQRWLDARVGQECEVLLENASRREATDDDSLQSWQGRDIYGALVHVPLPAGDHTGRLVNARIVEAKKHSLVAEATGQPW